MNKACTFFLGLSFASIVFAHAGPVFAGDLRVTYTILHHEALGDGASGFMQLFIENDELSDANYVELRIAPGTVAIGGSDVVQLGSVPAGEIRSAIASFVALADFPEERAPIEVVVDLDRDGLHQAYRVMAQAQ